MARHTRSGVQGMSTCRTPRWARASHTAFWTAGVEPIVHRVYDGGAIELPRGGTVLDPVAMPVLAGKAGHDIVTSSGDTLLGADDKAGVAEIMAAVAHLAAHPELPRPTLRVGFTVTKKTGNAVARNRIRRRLREAVRVLAADDMRLGNDYVIVGREDVLAAPFGQIAAELSRRIRYRHGK